MSLRDKLQEDWVAAVKSGNKIESSTINMVKAALLLKDKLNGEKVEDDKEVISIISKEIKQRKESVFEFEKGNRTDLVNKTNEEIDILKKYLPPQLEEDEILELIRTTAETIGAKTIKDMGKLMAELNPKIVGRADGKRVSILVKEHLNK